MIWIFLVPILLLGIGLFNLPIGYYTLVRIVVCLASVLCAWMSYASDKKIGFGSVFFALMAILFNPLIPIYLNKDIWTILDIIAMASFGIKYFQVRKNQEEDRN